MAERRPLSPGKIIREVCSLPTAPFREEFVAEYVKTKLDAMGVDWKCDKHGNIVAHVKRGRRKLVPMALVAHMDHPGFVSETGTKKAGVVKARILGGVGGELEGKKVRFLCDPEQVGVIESVHGKDARNRPIHAKIRVNGPVPDDTIGMWDVKIFERKKGMIHARVIDDLAGVAVMLLVLDRVSREEGDIDLRCCFTRAEEVGFVGAYALAKSKLLPKETRVVSIETSKALKGRSEHGKGFTIRLGDYMTIFEPAMTGYMVSVAREMAKEKSFKFQAALLDGGACEATLFNQLGYHAAGVALPLGNYHNRTPRMGVGPEYIHGRDFKCMVEFLATLAERMPGFKDHGKGVRDRIDSIWANWKDRL